MIVSSTDFSQHFSVEFFPPKTLEGADKLRATRQSLAQLKPEYFSVTFGAGGSTQAGTRDTVFEIQKEGYIAAPHISCIGRSRADLREILAEYKLAGIRRLVALRGDLPSGFGGSSGDFSHANELIEFVRAESAQKIGADVPVVAGVMPITNYTQLMRFSDMCGAEIPRWVRLKLASFGDDSASIRAFGLDVVTSLCQRLLDGGAPGLHFYSLNQAGPTLAICQQLR